MLRNAIGGGVCQICRKSITKHTVQCYLHYEGVGWCKMSRKSTTKVYCSTLLVLEGGSVKCPGKKHYVTFECPLLLEHVCMLIPTILLTCTSLQLVAVFVSDFLFLSLQKQIIIAVVVLVLLVIIIIVIATTV